MGIKVAHHSPRKRLGQHFLRDPYTIESIITSIAPQPGQSIVEIGPGLGAITRPLLENLGHLDVVELDAGLIPKLESNCGFHERLHIHHCDALTFDFGSIASSPTRLRITGNLPYNISTPLIFHSLKFADIVHDMHFLLQKEVVDRIAAPPATREYGRLSVMVQYHCRAELLFYVAAEAFSPPPKVESAFLRLTPYALPPIAVNDKPWFARIVNTAFSYRRKTLKNSLKTILSEDTIKAAGIDPLVRPDTLSVAEFASLANHSKSE